MTTKKKKQNVGGAGNFLRLQFNFPNILLLLIGILFIVLSIQLGHIQDDSYITFRYVENFVNGNGLVFNIGENVEGYTSLLWVLLLSGVKIIGIDIISASQFLGLFFSFITIIITRKIFLHFIDSVILDERILKERKNIWLYISLLPSLMLALNGAFQYWSISGMETALFISLVTLSIYSYAMRPDEFELTNFTAISLILASVTRPEGMFIVILIIFHMTSLTLIKHKRLTDIKEKLFSKENVNALLIIFIPYILMVIFRLFYYGYPFPNTYYAKSGLSAEYFKSGLEYFLTFNRVYLLYGVMLIIPFALLMNKKLRINVVLMELAICSFIIYTILIGGDVLPIYRFFLPILPLIFILFCLVIYYPSNLFIQKSSKKIIFSGEITIVILISVLTIYNNFHPYDHIQKKADSEQHLIYKMKSAGEWLSLQQRLSKHPLTVAATTIGALSYYSNVTIIDMLGLTDERIAHNPLPIPSISGIHSGWREKNYNVPYVLSRNPDYIFFSTDIKPSAYAERALFTSEKFINGYYPSHFIVNKGDQKGVATIYKKRPAEMMSSFSQEFSANPNYSEEYIHKYNSLLSYKANKSDLKTLNKKIGECYKLIKISPLNFGDPYRLLGRFYSIGGNKVEAIKAYEECIKRDPTNASANAFLLVHYRKLHDSRQDEYYLNLKKYNPEILKLHGYK